jgi:hypothetical protein
MITTKGAKVSTLQYKPCGATQKSSILKVHRECKLHHDWIYTVHYVGGAHGERVPHVTNGNRVTDVATEGLSTVYHPDDQIRRLLLNPTVNHFSTPFSPPSSLSLSLSRLKNPRREKQRERATAPHEIRTEQRAWRSKRTAVM